jgi:hypothetical protein
MQLEGLGQLQISNDLISNRNRNLPSGSIVHQPSTLPRTPYENSKKTKPSIKIYLRAVDCV